MFILLLSFHKHKYILISDFCFPLKHLAHGNSSDLKNYHLMKNVKNNSSIFLEIPSFFFQNFNKILLHR